MSQPATVRLESVVKHYSTAAGKVRAVDGISLEVEAGGSLAIIGPSGCGKSTLLSMIGGLETPSRGKVLVGGREISAMSERKRARLRREEFGFLFQSHDLLPFLTATENVLLPLALRGAKDGAERCRELLDRLEVADQAGKLPDQLSGGQRQRIALARALIHEPGLILADEPTGELDTASATAVVGLLVTAQKDLGATLIVVTHDPYVAGQMERVVALKDGRLTAGAGAEGQPQDA